ncbi:unnamed protein product [Brassica rapa subsp. trilocularis]
MSEGVPPTCKATKPLGGDRLAFKSTSKCIFLNLHGPYRESPVAK